MANELATVKNYAVTKSDAAQVLSESLSEGAARLLVTGQRDRGWESRWGVRGVPHE